MKLQKIHIFLILLLSLIFCSCLGGFLREGMTDDSSDAEQNDKSQETYDKDGNAGGDNYAEYILHQDALEQQKHQSSDTVQTEEMSQMNYASNNNVNKSGGVKRSDIPTGQHDLYILKSEIVPPVCPVCPQAAACPRQEKCPACPACARCPEPAFECKKVPNYASANDNYLPRPVLADFSQFGM